MSELRDEVIIELTEYGYTVDEDRRPQVVADRILAAVHAALTSDAAVEAAKTAERALQGHALTVIMQQALTAALAAAGITKGEGDDSR